MRVLLINPNTSSDITESLANIAKKTFSSEIELTAVSAPFGPAAVASDLDEAVSEIAVLEALAGRRGEYDGAIIACFGDPGVKVARQILDVPVIGIAEAAYHGACFYGERFSVITTGGKAESALTWAAVERCGLVGRCASIRPLGIDLLDVDEKALSALEREIGLAVREDGARAAVLGCAALAGMGDDIAARLSIPVVDGITQAALFMEAMLRPAWRKMLFPKERPSVPFESAINCPNLTRFYK